jgi:hypothetical protein
LPQNSQLEAPEDQEMEQDDGQRLSMVKLPSIHSLEDKHEFVKNFEKTILNEFYKNRVPDL